MLTLKVLKPILIFLFLLTLKPILANEFEFPTRLSLKSGHKLQGKNLHKTSAAIFEIWEKLLHSDSKEKAITTDNGLFYGELKTIDDSVYVRVTNLQSQETTYHFLNDHDFEDFQKIHKVKLKSTLLDTSIYGLEGIYNRYKEIDAVEKQKIEDLKKIWDSESLQTMDEIKYLYERLRKKWDDLQAKNNMLDEEFRRKFIDRNGVYIHDPKVGQAELNTINGKPFVRIVHFKTELSFGLAPHGSIDLNSEHFKKYVARQHIDAGKGRLDGEYGRDFIYITLDNWDYNIDVAALNPKNYNEYKRYKMNTKEYWEEYWVATKSKPKAADVSFGIFCGIQQGALTFCVGNGLNNLNQIYEIGLDPINVLPTSIFVTVWGSMFGTISSTFKNWVNRGPDVRRTLKNMTNGILFQVAMTGIMRPEGFATFALNTIMGWYEVLKVYGASYVSNRAKPNWYNNGVLRERMGISKKKVEFKLGKLKIKTPWKQSNFEQQVVFYMPAFITRFLERTNLLLPPQIPAGFFLLMSTVPFSEYLFLKHATKKAIETRHPVAIEMAKKARTKWQFQKTFYSDGKLRLLILKRFFYQLTFLKKAENKILKELSDIYPDHYTYRPLKEKRKNISVELKSFKVPQNQEAMNCASLLSSLSLLAR